MAILTRRQNLYGSAMVVENNDGTYTETSNSENNTRKVVHTELDYLDSAFNHMELQTTDSFLVSQVFEYRPDLISHQIYGTYDLGWLIAAHNGFMDMIFDFKLGTKIKIPSRADYYRFYSNYGRDF